MTKNRRYQQGRPRQSHHGRVTERTTVKIEIDAGHYTWEQGEDDHWAAWSFLLSHGFGPVPAELIPDDEISSEISAANADRLAECTCRRVAILRDGKDGWYAIGGGGGSEGDAEDALRGEAGAWLAKRIGRAGMLDLAMAWSKDGPFAFFDSSYADEAAAASRRTVRQAFEDWRAVYFTNGWNVSSGSEEGR